MIDKKKYLFLVMLGGRAKKANIELHDVRWVIGSKIEDTYNVLRSDWFGNFNTPRYCEPEYQYQHHIKITPKSHRNHIKIMSKSHQNHYQNHVKIMSKTCQNHVKNMP